MLRKGFGAWSSRRSRTRARRARIRETILAASAPELPGVESIDETLRERIGDYTHGEEAFALQPAMTVSLRSTVTGPGFACPTTQIENR